MQNKLLKKFSLKLIPYIRVKESRIKKIEYIRGLYRYPTNMLGRNIPNNYSDNTDVLVFAAHPDDDVLGLGTTLYRHSMKGENIKVVFVTNGSGWNGESWNISVTESKRRSEIRYQEAVQALSLIDIPGDNISCLGYPDSGTHRYLNNISMDIYKLIRQFNPGRIYVHCIEGGHIDHDMTSFVVKSICNKIGYHNVFEWAEYNKLQPLGTHDVKFLRRSKAIEEMKINISNKERFFKKRMLSCHKSQDVKQYYLQGEAIRHADTSQIDIELFELSELPKEKLEPLVNNFNTSMKNLYLI